MERTRQSIDFSGCYRFHEQRLHYTNHQICWKLELGPLGRSVSRLTYLGRYIPVDPARNDTASDETLHTLVAGRHCIKQQQKNDAYEIIYDWSPT